MLFHTRLLENQHKKFNHALEQKSQQFLGPWFWKAPNKEKAKISENGPKLYQRDEQSNLTTNFYLKFKPMPLWYNIRNNLAKTNIAGRLPENSRNRFVDRPSKKTVKKTDQKNLPFHWRLICYILIKNLYKLLLPLLADLK